MRATSNNAFVGTPRWAHQMFEYRNDDMLTSLHLRCPGGQAKAREASKELMVCAQIVVSEGLARDVAGWPELPRHHSLREQLTEARERSARLTATIDVLKAERKLAEVKAGPGLAAELLRIDDAIKTTESDQAAAEKERAVLQPLFTELDAELQNRLQALVPTMVGDERRRAEDQFWEAIEQAHEKAVEVAATDLDNASAYLVAINRLKGVDPFGKFERVIETTQPAAPETEPVAMSTAEAEPSAPEPAAAKTSEAAILDPTLPGVRPPVPVEGLKRPGIQPSAHERKPQEPTSLSVASSR
jgi:hypothetical protein